MKAVLWSVSCFRAAARSSLPGHKEICVYCVAGDVLLIDIFATGKYFARTTGIFAVSVWHCRKDYLFSFVENCALGCMFIEVLLLK